MIPPEWMPVCRQDQETVGYLAFDGENFQAYDLLARALGKPQDFLTAEQLVLENGLAYLSKRWLLQRPQDPEPFYVAIQELQPELLSVLVDDTAAVQALGSRIELQLPEHIEYLREDPEDGWPRFIQAMT